MKPAVRQSKGVVGGRNDMRPRGLTPHAQPQPLRAAQALADDGCIVLDTRGRLMIDFDALAKRLVALGFTKQ